MAEPATIDVPAPSGPMAARIPDIRAAGPARTAGLTGRTPTRCQWCGRELDHGNGGVGRPRMYCAQSCRQRAYEHRTALQRGGLPTDAVVLSAAERDDLADRLFQVRCAAEDIATALAEKATPSEMQLLVTELIAAARSAERIRRS